MLERTTLLEININNILNNIEYIKKITHNKEFMAVVKADAYGLGAIPISKELQKSGINYLCVASLNEAVELRENGIRTNIMTFCPFFENGIPYIEEYNIIPTIVDYNRAKTLDMFMRKQNKIANCFFKFDTGMGRLGERDDIAYNTLLKIMDLKNIQLLGVYSHLSTADTDDVEYSQHQINRFKSFIEKMENDKIKLKMNHLANSSATLRYPESHFDAVRVGIYMYGAYPSNIIQEKYPIKRVIKLKSKIVFIKKFYAGESISYGRTFQTEKDMTVAVIPIGYADGYSTLLSNKGQVKIKNSIVNVLGRICMDYTMIDISNVPKAQVGDEVIIYDEEITPEIIAEKTGTISYEVLTSINKRVLRIYKIQ